MEWDMADVKPSIISWVIVGLMAMTFIAIAKFMAAKYPIPDAFKQVINAV